MRGSSQGVFAASGDDLHVDDTNVGGPAHKDDLRVLRPAAEVAHQLAVERARQNRRRRRHAGAQVGAQQGARARGDGQRRGHAKAAGLGLAQNGPQQGPGSVHVDDAVERDGRGAVGLAGQQHGNRPRPTNRAQSVLPVAQQLDQGHDERGIVWPAPLAPFQVALLPMNLAKSQRVREAANALHDSLVAAGIEVLFDDRGVRPGVMFADSELLVDFTEAVDPATLSVTIWPFELDDEKVRVRIS